MKQYDIGLDLGTTSIIIATQEQGVVFHQPSIGAVDTRSSTILAVGDKALRMVGVCLLILISSALCGTVLFRTTA